MYLGTWRGYVYAVWWNDDVYGRYPIFYWFERRDRPIDHTAGSYKRISFYDNLSCRNFQRHCCVFDNDSRNDSVSDLRIWKLHDLPENSISLCGTRYYDQCCLYKEIEGRIVQWRRVCIAKDLWERPGFFRDRRRFYKI